MLPYVLLFVFSVVKVDRSRRQNFQSGNISYSNIYITVVLDKMFLALPKSRNPRSRVNPIPSTAKVMHFQIDVTVCAF